MSVHKDRGVLNLGCLTLAVMAATSLSGCSGKTSDSISLLFPTPTEFFPALIAFLIIWVVLAKFIFPSVLQTMQTREDKIKQNLESAQKAQDEAEQQAATYTKKLADAQIEADKIVAAAKREAEQERVRIISHAQNEAVDIIAKAHETVKDERQKAIIELSSSVVGLSVEIAGKIIGNDLSVDQQRRLAEKYLAEVGVQDE